MALEREREGPGKFISEDASSGEGSSPLPAWLQAPEEEIWPAGAPGPEEHPAPPPD